MARARTRKTSTTPINPLALRTVSRARPDDSLVTDVPRRDRLHKARKALQWLVLTALKKIGPAYSQQIAASITDSNANVTVTQGEVDHAVLGLSNDGYVTNLLSERDLNRGRGMLWVYVYGDRQGTRPNAFDLPEMPSDTILVALRRCLKGVPKGTWIAWESFKRAINVAESRLSSQLTKLIQHGDVTVRNLPGHGRNAEYQWLEVPRPNEPDILKKRAGRPDAPLESYVPPEELYARLSKRDIKDALAVAPRGESDVSTRELAEWLDAKGVTPRQIERWRRRGEGPEYILEKGPKGTDVVRYLVSDVTAWLEGKL